MHIPLPGKKRKQCQNQSLFQRIVHGITTQKTGNLSKVILQAERERDSDEKFSDKY